MVFKLFIDKNCREEVIANVRERTPLVDEIERLVLQNYNGPPVKTTLSNFIVNQIFPILTLAASRATPHI